jgi:hypothetical protein
VDDAIKEGEAPTSPDWRDGLEPRIRAHVAYCQNYVTNHNHGAPGHLDRVTVDALAKLLDGAPVTITTRYEISLSGADEVSAQIKRLLAKYGGAL